MRSIAKIELKPLTNTVFFKNLYTCTSKILHTGFMPDVTKEAFDVLAIVNIDLNLDVENWLKHNNQFNKLHKYKDVVFVFSCTEEEFTEYAFCNCDVDKFSYTEMCERVKTMVFDKFSLNVECFIVVKDKFVHIFNNRIKKYLKSLSDKDFSC